MTSEPTVTISLPSHCVERRASRDGHEFFVARLPEGTRVGDLDLSGWHVCATTAHDNGERAGITQLVVLARVSTFGARFAETPRWEASRLGPA